MKNKNKLLVTLVSVLVLSIMLVVSCKEKFDHTIDTMNPVVVSYNPASAVEGVAVNSNLIITFSENVKKRKW